MPQTLVATGVNSKCPKCRVYTDTGYMTDNGCVNCDPNIEEVIEAQVIIFKGENKDEEEIDDKEEGKGTG
jgi:hypothetical protein